MSEGRVRKMDASVAPPVEGGGTAHKPRLLGPRHADVFYQMTEQRAD